VNDHELVYRRVMPEARAGFLTSLDTLEDHLAHLVQGERS